MRGGMLLAALLFRSCRRPVRTCVDVTRTASVRSDEMSSLRLRASAAGALVSLAIAVPAVRIDASDLGACSLRPSEGDNPENLGAILEDAAALAPKNRGGVGS